MFKAVLTICIAILAAKAAMAQNSNSFFKVALAPNTDMPQWAQEMYSQDPDVFRVDALYSEYYAQNSFQKNIHTQNYKHWRRKVNE